jgi:hypothetical protein
VGAQAARGRAGALARLRWTPQPGKPTCPPGRCRAGALTDGQVRRRELEHLARAHDLRGAAERQPPPVVYPHKGVAARDGHEVRRGARDVEPLELHAPTRAPARRRAAAARARRRGAQQHVGRRRRLLAGQARVELAHCAVLAGGPEQARLAGRDPDVLQAKGGAERRRRGAVGRWRGVTAPTPLAPRPTARSKLAPFALFSPAAHLPPYQHTHLDAVLVAAEHRRARPHGAHRRQRRRRRCAARRGRGAAAPRGRRGAGRGVELVQLHGIVHRARHHPGSAAARQELHAEQVAAVLRLERRRHARHVGGVPQQHL